ncbi:putative FAD-linked oxidoreductase [Sulfitobacter sp. THAF37]|uniref:FAD-binding protein n=1 Tax=Sulfitobacter sp. THAF37 TaxID=2587855 RepID=UPI001268F077|nr:FAD-binding protein [Sulfitobacter sp. THAF37]QFT58000.1 putative FAD-linked oxidoreductase [Sulfitobacter sp. THAF37]
MKITTEAELSAAVIGAGGPLSIRGGDTRGFAGAGEPLSVAGLSGISLYEPGALTLVVKAGTPVAQIEAALAEANQRLAFEPMDHRGLLGTGGEPTIGGIFAANVGGPRRLAVGAARDFLLGVRFVDGRGALIRNGGRVMKNVTGYDLVKLMAGSFGTLGVLTEVSLKVLPRPETEATLILGGLDDASAVAALCRAMGSPYEVTGAAHDPAAGETCLRLEGFEDSVSYRMARLRDLLGHADTRVSEGSASARIWAGLRDVEPFHEAQGDVWKVSCKPSDGPGLAERSGAEAHYFDWSGGLIWLRSEPGCDLRARLGAFDGHATLIRADAATKSRLGRFHPEPPGVARLTSGLRARFDPRNIFSRGEKETA